VTEITVAADRPEALSLPLCLVLAFPITAMTGVHRKSSFAFWGGIRRFRRLLQFLWVFNSGDFGNHGNFGNLWRPSAYVPSARTPTPHSALLKTKAKVQFDRAVTERSKPFFYRFCQPNRCHFAGLFALVTLCRLICRQRVANVPKAARRNDRRASNCHRERAAQPGAERSKTRDPNSG